MNVRWTDRFNSYDLAFLSNSTLIPYTCTFILCTSKIGAPGLQETARIHHHADATVDDKDGLLASCGRARCSHYCNDECAVGSKGRCTVIVYLL